MAKSKTLTYDELLKQVLNLTLDHKLTLLQELKQEIDATQTDLASQLDSIKAVKSKINGEGK